MANPYQNIMNYVPSASAGFRPKESSRVWDNLWGEAAVTSDNGEEEEVVVEAPVTDEDNISEIKNLWNDLKTDFVKGKDEATAEVILNNLHNIESGIWGSLEERRVNTPWVNPDNVIADINKPRSEWQNIETIAGWNNPDYVASDLAANRAATTVSGGDTLQATGLNTPVDNIVSSGFVTDPYAAPPDVESFQALANVPQMDLNYITDIKPQPYVEQFESMPGPHLPTVAEQTQNNIWESPFVPNPGQWDEQERIDERLAQNAERIRSEQAARKREQARIQRMEVKKRKDEQAAKNLKKQEAQLRTQRTLDDLMSKTAARGRQQGRAFTGPMANLWT